ncbi:MAG TPA: glycosyltransferase [Candidatus Acidoferrum sp.]|nr:glycosyltransferase [Candidatus Acidoferrum sp.]
MSSPHSERVAAHFDRLAAGIPAWRRRNRYYHTDVIGYMQYLCGRNLRVLELGSGTGDLLAALEPSYGVGIDISAAMVAQAQASYPQLQFRQGDAHDLSQLQGEQFDIIVLSDLLGYLDDVQACFEQVHTLCHADTRILINNYSFIWEPALTVAEKLGLKMPNPLQSWLAPNDLRNLMTLTDFQQVKFDRRLLLPFYVPLLSALINNIGTLPGLNALCLSNYMVARPMPSAKSSEASVTIVIPCRNERGNIADAVARLPAFGSHQEIIFVEGHSKDDTVDEIKRVIAANPGKDIKLMVQTGKGKGDAVRMGFAAAQGDILMILDADLTVPPEDLPRFYNAMVQNKAEFLNGSRLVYPMEDQAMRLLNLIANKFFAAAFSWLLGQRLKDTLCGTKVIWKKDYEMLAANRAYFGEFDPFGDFDLLFGASKLNLKLLEIPIRYRARTYGETQISRFRHGWLLLRMTVYAWRKLKAP